MSPPILSLCLFVLQQELNSFICVVLLNSLTYFLCFCMKIWSILYLFQGWKGEPGFPGPPGAIGLPGFKGHKVSILQRLFSSLWTCWSFKYPTDVTKAGKKRVRFVLMLFFLGRNWKRWPERIQGALLPLTPLKSWHQSHLSWIQNYNYWTDKVLKKPS